SMIAITTAGIASAVSTVSICISMPCPPATADRGFGSFTPDLQYRQEGLLRNLDLSHLLHALLALFLLFEQLALARDVAAIALGQHVLAQRLDRGARDHVAPDGGLHS